MDDWGNKFHQGPCAICEGLNTGWRLCDCISIPDPQCFGHMNNEYKHRFFGDVMHNIFFFFFSCNFPFSFYIWLTLEAFSSSAGQCRINIYHTLRREKLWEIWVKVTLVKESIKKNKKNIESRYQVRNVTEKWECWVLASLRQAPTRPNDRVAAEYLSIPLEPTGWVCSWFKPTLHFAFWNY